MTMLTLGIETSCDETAVAVVKNGKEVLSNIVSSSLHLHKPYGGIVPEIASRHHVELIDTCLARALKEAGCKLNKIDLIAVTCGPGLVGALLIGVAFAKALSLAANISLVGVNHLKAHMYAALMSNEDLRSPFIGLIVSGGHTSLVLAEDAVKMKLLGQTIDDAAGEAFDKVARILGLGFPGGPVIEKLAKKGNPKAIKFAQGLLDDGSLDFSFSGIKTAVLYHVQRKKHGTAADICASFQDSVVGALVKKTLLACKKKKIKRVAVGGGVSINSHLRKSLEKEAAGFGIKTYFPDKRLCLDNAAMVAGLGYRLYRKKGASRLNLQAEPNLSI